MSESEDLTPLPSVIGADFEHEKMLEYGLPLRYSEIDWQDSNQRDGYILFVIWFLEQLIAGGIGVDSDAGETPELIALRAELDQLHAEMRENAILAGLDISDSPAPFSELESNG